MSFYASSVAVDPVSGAAPVISQPTSQALVLANSGPRYPVSTAVTIPTGRHNYMYGSYGQPVQYAGYPQSVPMYVQPQQQVVYTSMPATYATVPSYGSSYGYGAMPMTTQYYSGLGGGMIVQDPYGYSRRHRRHRRHSHSGYYY